MIKFKRQPGFIFLCLLLFCFSLDVQAPISFYGTQFVGLSLLLIYRFLVYPKISLNCIKLFLFTVVFLEVFCYFQNLYIQKDILLMVYQRVIFLISIAILLYDYLKNSSIEILKKVFAFFIISMSIVVVIQFFGFYLLNIDRTFLDFGLLLGGEESRTWYFGDWIYRPTGITSEPAIFVGVQFALLTIQYLLDKNAIISRLIGIFSLVLAMSFLGLILAALFLIIIYSKNIKNYIFGVFALILFYLFSFEMINTRVEIFLSGDDGSNNVKIEAFNYFLSDINITMFGYGFLFRSEGSPQFYDALLDLTFYLNIFTIFGLLFGSIFIFIFIYLIYKSETSIKEKLLICLSLIKLSNPSVLFFSLFVVLCVCILRKRKFL